MKRLVEGTDRGQSTLFPECPEDWIDENNPVRISLSSDLIFKRLRLHGASETCSAPAMIRCVTRLGRG